MERYLGTLGAAAIRATGTAPLARSIPHCYPFPMLHPSEVDAKIVDLQDRAIALARFAAQHEGVAFRAPTVGTTYRHVVVSPEPRCGGWRVTRFDRRGPAGHARCPSYAVAVQFAVEEGGADLARAEMSEVRWTPKEGRR